ncbi:MAG: AmmeMemoRadiSam system protein B, partial [Candidatus Omnitrophica bacterium]|nr:AmmeMemoRadiSam system protein B [Candidatus Omnitrophota bacterium]
MEESPLKPKVRTDLTVNPIEQDGQRILLIEDPLGIIAEPLAVTEVGGLILSLLDGERTAEDIEGYFGEVVRGEVPTGFVAEQIQQIASLGLLEDEDYHLKREEVLGTYKASTSRPPSHAGSAYVEDRDLLTSWMEEILGPSEDTSQSITAPRILVAPHIDFRVNTHTYASAYKRIRGCEYDRVVLMGTGHSILEGVYSPTAKNFSTPLGETPTDRAAIEALLSTDHGVVGSHDFPHKSEHALEFQLIFLQHLLGPGNFELVPILSGSVHAWLQSHQRLGQVEAVQSFLESLREIIQAPDRKTLVVAGVDFSHVGLRFSHPVPAAAMLEETRKHDRQLIDAFNAWDVESFWGTEAESQGRFNVCGFSTLSTLMEAMEPVETECLSYEVWDDTPTGSAVTFAAIS